MSNLKLSYKSDSTSHSINVSIPTEANASIHDKLNSIADATVKLRDQCNLFLTELLKTTVEDEPTNRKSNAEDEET